MVAVAQELKAAPLNMQGRGKHETLNYLSIGYKLPAAYG
jgi:hypothetical protein